MKFAIVTPSYHKDFPRCSLLAETVEKYTPAEISYYIVVSREDQGLFAPLESPRTRVLLEENIVGFDTYRIKWAPRWRLSSRTLPVRGWIWQQIVKLSLANALREDVLMIVDSDCAFFRPFDPRSVEDSNGLIPLYREEKEFYVTDRNTQKWHSQGQKILKIRTPIKTFATGYVAAPVFWRRDVLMLLQSHLEKVNFFSAPCRISMCPTFSEYVVYGMFVEHILGIKNSGHYILDHDLAHNHWTEKTLNIRDLRAFCQSIPEHLSMIHINGKSQTTVEDIRLTLEELKLRNGS